MSQTPHVNEIGQVFTLTIGQNTWPAMLAAAGVVGLHLGHVEFGFRVETGGPVSHASSSTTMTAIGDGESYVAGAGRSVNQGDHGVIDGTLQRFWATANGDKLYVYARNR